MKQKPFTKLQSRAPTLNSQQRILFTMFTRPDWSSSGQPTSSTNAIIPYSAAARCPVTGGHLNRLPSSRSPGNLDTGPSPPPPDGSHQSSLIVALTPGGSWWVGV